MSTITSSRTRTLQIALAGMLAACQPFVWAAAPTEGASVRESRNVVIFVADGLRHGSVNPVDAPTLSDIRERGVSFVNSHALFPTFTTANASALATGHYLGDTGDFSNAIYIGFPIFDDRRFGRSPGTYVPFLENDEVISDLNAHVPSGNYLNEDSLLAVARAHGYGTAAIGKLGPVVIQDVTEVNSDGERLPVPQTVIIDDFTGSAVGVPLSDEVVAALKRADLPLAAPRRDQPQGNVRVPGTDRANVAQQDYFVAATTRAVLPLLGQRGHPFVLVYWSRDPDGTQHNQGDSLNSLAPGINGPTSKQAVRNADSNLKQILDYIRADPELANSTDIVVTADHGFSTVSKREIDAAGHRSRGYSAQFSYRTAQGAVEVEPGALPLGFLAIDLAHVLELPLFDPDSQSEDGTRLALVDPTTETHSRMSRQRPAQGNGLIGGTGRHLAVPDARVIVAANGGSDLVYLLDRDAGLLRRIVDFLGSQDYVDGLFVDDSFGEFPGALPLSSIGLQGASPLPLPTIVVTFRAFALNPRDTPMSTVQVADTGLQEGQGMHGGFSRADTFIHMAAIGPDFKRRYVDAAPVSNADIAPTLARILGFKLEPRGTLEGRVIEEALRGGPKRVRFERRLRVSEPNGSQRATALVYQVADGRDYYDVACFVDVASSGVSRANPCDR